MERKLKLAVIGFGRIVELLHLPMINRMQKLEITGIYDITPERLELARKRKLPVYTHLDELLASDADAVLVATPPSSHAHHAKRALESGKHVLAEKPVSLNASEAEELQQTARRTGKSLTVFMNRRYDTDFLAVKRCIESGQLGAIQFIERRHHVFGSGAAFSVKSFDPNWRNKPELGGGALLDWGVHLLDQLQRLRLGTIRSVNAQVRTLPWQQGEVEDFVQAHFDLDTGIQLVMDINFASHAASPLWIVGGERATLVVQSEKEASLLRSGVPPEPVPMPPVSRYAAMPIYQNFADHLLTGSPLDVTIDQAIETMRLLDRLREFYQKEEYDADHLFLASGGI